MSFSCFLALSLVSIVGKCAASVLVRSVAIFSMASALIALAKSILRPPPAAAAVAAAPSFPVVCKPDRKLCSSDKSTFG